MRLALAQINPIVGDLAGNAALMRSWIERGVEAGADLIVFPELSLTGYPPKDLLLQEGFLEEAVAQGRALIEGSPAEATVVFGSPLPIGEHEEGVEHGSRRTGLANGLVACRGGEMVAWYDKRLLPTYDVFDEDRYFEPGSRPVVIEVAGVRVGLSICEDLWRGEDVGFADRYMRAHDPVGELVKPPDGSPGAQVVVNPSASPFVLGKAERHLALLREHATRHGVYVAAVNQVGGNDELIFDGRALLIAPSGATVGAAPVFEEHLLITDIDPAGAEPSPVGADPRTSMCEEETVYRALVLGTRDYCRKTGFKSAVLGLSGGIDSSVVAVIGAAALGRGNVHGVSMPSRYSSEHSRTDASELAERLGVPMRTIPIEDAFIAVEKSMDEAFEGTEMGVTEENIQSRLRGLIVMALSNKFGPIVLTTGNKSELAVGYCTLYGDMNGGLAVISDVPKLSVYRLARWMNEHPEKLGIEGLTAGTEGPIPPGVITKPPSAELRPDQTDQDSLPEYEVLDEIVRRYVEGREHPKRIVEETGFDARVVARIVRLVDVNEYKRKQLATGLKLTSIAFGSGRRVPIAQGYRPDRSV